MARDRILEDARARSGVIAPTTLEEIAKLAQDPSARALDAALLVGRCLDESFDADRIRGKLGAISEHCEGAPWDHLRQLGFGTAQHRGDGDVPALSRMDLVLARRRGLPIVLGTLLIEVAGAAGRRATGVNFPGHFLVRVDGRLVDPLQMMPRSEAECLSLVPEGYAGHEADAMFEEASALDILLRMLNNLKYYYLGTGELAAALDMVECQLKALPGEPGLLLEQGEMWAGLGSTQSARYAFAAAEAAAAASGHADAAAIAKRRLEALAEWDDPLH